METAADANALPRVAARLRELAIPASFACIGLLVDRFPEAHRVLAASGLELFNHTHSHPWHDELGTAERWRDLSRERMRGEIVSANEALRALGVEPRGFRTPHFGTQHDAREYALIEQAGLRYSSSTIAGESGGAPYVEGRIVEIPLLVCPAHRTSPLDSWHCTTAPDAAHRSDVVPIHRAALDAVASVGGFGAIYWDPRVALEPAYDRALEEIAVFGRSYRLASLRDVAEEVFAATAS